MKRMLMVALLMLGDVNYCSDNNEDAPKSLLEHQHLFRNGLPAVAIGGYGMRLWGHSFFEFDKIWKEGKSVSHALLCFSAIATFKLTSLAVLGDCIDLERARLKRIEDMLKRRQ